MPSPPSLQCDTTKAPPDTAGYHRCYEGRLLSDPSFYYSRPGEVPPRGRGAKSLRPDDLALGFGFGMILTHYCLDWGDCVGVIRRKKAYPTIMHTWPRKIERSYALRFLPAFTSPKDLFLPPFTLFLVQAKPFAGYRWNAEALRKWLIIADAAATGLGGPQSLSADASGFAALAWIAAVLPAWRESTPETFPYGVGDIATYWHA